MATSIANKRHSLLAPIAQAGPKPPVHFSSSLIIAEQAILVGTYKISISSESVIHPRARLDSRTGPLVLGRRVIVHERTNVGIAPEGPPSTSNKDSADAGVTIGDYVTIEVGSVVEAGGTVIGDGTVVGINSKVGSGAVIGKYCTLAPQSIITAGQVVPDLSVVFSDGMRRIDKRDVTDSRHRAQALQISVLRSLIPSSPARFQ